MVANDLTTAFDLLDRAKQVKSLEFDDFPKFFVIFMSTMFKPDRIGIYNELNWVQ